MCTEYKNRNGSTDKGWAIRLFGDHYSPDHSGIYSVYLKVK